MDSFDLFNHVIVPARAAVGCEQITYRKFLARTRAALDACDLRKIGRIDSATGRKIEAVDLTTEHLRVALRKEPQQARKYAQAILNNATPGKRQTSKEKSTIFGFNTEDVVLSVLALNAIC